MDYYKIFLFVFFVFFFQVLCTIGNAKLQIAAVQCIPTFKANGDVNANWLSAMKRLRKDKVLVDTDIKIGAVLGLLAIGFFVAAAVQDQYDYMYFLGAGILIYVRLFIYAAYASATLDLYTDGDPNFFTTKR